MGRRERRRILVGLAVTMFLGIAVYFRLWAIDYSVSSADAELLRFVPFFFSSKFLGFLFFW